MGDRDNTRASSDEPKAADYLELLRHARDVILIIQDGVVVFVNRTLDGSGYAREELLGQTLDGLPGISQQIRRHYSSRIAGEATPSIYKTKIVAKDGHEIDVEISATMARYQGKPSVVAVLRDISERERISRELAESEERFRCLSEAAFEGIAIHMDGRIAEVNQAFCELTDRSREELMGFPVLELLTPTHREMVIEKVKAGYEKAYEVEGVRPDGTTNPIEVLGRNILYKGQPARVTALRDLSERNKLQAQIQRAQKLESLGVLAGGIAHDFNNLLMGVLGNASLALHVLPPRSPAREHVQEINSVAQHAAGLTSQMLAYSGGGRYVIEPLHLSSLVEEMGNLLQLSVSKKVSLRYNLRSDLPHIEADASQVRQVVMNLIINASEASEELGGVVAVRTDVARVASAVEEGYITGDCSPEGDCVLFEVRDSGCGMDADTMERIFDPFFTTKFTGRGLGLAAVLGIVRGHHGAIRVQSSPGKGSRFEILFPSLAKVEEQATRPPERQPASIARGGTVLLVDDDPTARLVAQKMLESLGFVVLSAADGREGVSLFKERGDGVALVLLDRTMPVMGGEEALVEIKRLRPDVQVILTSGYEEKEATERIVERDDLAGFIQKPYQLEDLDEIIRRALG
jgi:PAS domain S-box-containing protein